MLKSFIVMFSVFLSLLLMDADSVFASPNMTARAPKAETSTEALKYRYEMNLDLSVIYFRDTRPIGGTDAGARMNLGGMFSNWAGLDAMGVMGVKSKSYLLGSTLKLVPIDWFFLKVGGGVFADKISRELRATPILGAGIMGRFTEYYYMVAEGIYFNASQGGKNIGFSAGLGLIF